VSAGRYFRYDAAIDGVAVELGKHDIGENAASAFLIARNDRGGGLVAARL
jgi:hypothetical protein